MVFPNSCSELSLQTARPGECVTDSVPIEYQHVSSSAYLYLDPVMMDGMKRTLMVNEKKSHLDCNPMSVNIRVVEVVYGFLCLLFGLKANKAELPRTPVPGDKTLSSCKSSN